MSVPDKTVAVVTYEATPPGVNAASNSTDTKKYSKEYDIVIIAEGTVSPAREVVFKPRKLAPIYGHYQTIVPTPAGLIPGAFYDIWFAIFFFGVRFHQSGCSNLDNKKGS
jgi:hypothetical protein